MQLETKNKLNLYVPLLLWMAVIYAFSSLSVTPSVDFYIWDFIVKKTAHVVEYYVFTMLFFRALANSGVKRKQALVISFFACFIYGALDEFHQSFTPGRQPTVRDVFIDTFGGTLAIITIWKLLPQTQGRLRSLVERLQLL